MPAHRSTIYRYVRFLREEGQIAASSLPQYLAAISMVHQSNGLLGFSAFDGVTRRLTQAWNNASTTKELRVIAVSAMTIYNVLQLVLKTQDIGILRACTSALLDYIFFQQGCLRSPAPSGRPDSHSHNYYIPGTCDQGNQNHASRTADLHL